MPSYTITGPTRVPAVSGTPPAPAPGADLACSRGHSIVGGGFTAGDDCPAHVEDPVTLSLSPCGEPLAVP